MPLWRAKGFVRASPRAVAQTWAASVEEAENYWRALHWYKLFSNAVVAD